MGCSPVVRAARPERGYAMLLAMLMIFFLGILILKARVTWETVVQRDNEEELFFRARQYVNALDAFMKKHNGLSPEAPEDLVKEFYLRRLYSDPMSSDGRWDLIFRDRLSGGNKKLLVAPASALKQLRGRAQWVGVCSSSSQEGFREYRNKKKYNEWAIYVGDNPKEEMPEIVVYNEKQ